MCCCEKPVINGEYGYKWNTTTGIHPIDTPAIEEGETIIFDEPGRCGGIDSHSHHYRLIRGEYGGIQLLVRHGAGDERIPYLSNDKALVSILETLDSNGRYWILNTLYHAQSKARALGAMDEKAKWMKAAAEKRIKTRKMPAQKQVKVWIEPAQSGVCQNVGG